MTTRWSPSAAPVPLLAGPPRRSPGPPRRADPGVAGERVGLRAAHRRPQERLRPDVRSSVTTGSTRPSSTRTCARLEAQARAALAREGFAESRDAPRPPSPTCATSVRPGRSRVELPPGAIDARERRRRPWSASTPPHEQRYGYSYRTRRRSGADGARQGLEWVNLRVVGHRCRSPEPRCASWPPGDGRAERARTGTRPVIFARRPRRVSRVRAHALAPGDALERAGDRRRVRRDDRRLSRISMSTAIASAT